MKTVGGTVVFVGGIGELVGWTGVTFNVAAVVAEVGASANASAVAG